MKPHHKRRDDHRQRTDGAKWWLLSESLCLQDAASARIHCLQCLARLHCLPGPGPFCKNRFGSIRGSHSGPKTLSTRVKVPQQLQAVTGVWGRPNARSQTRSAFHDPVTRGVPHDAALQRTFESLLDHVTTLGPIQQSQSVHQPHPR